MPFVFSNRADFSRSLFRISRNIDIKVTATDISSQRSPLVSDQHHQDNTKMGFSLNKV